VRASAQIDISALIRDDDLVDFLSIRSEQFNILIRNLTEDVRHRIERETLGAIFEGRGNEEIAKKIREIDGIGRNRSRLIARDQASKLNGAMNEFRQRQAGVTHYRWKSMMDPPRAREVHMARNGKIYRWDAPPAGGHPGNEILCRCRGLAVLIETPEDAEEVSPDEPLGSQEEALGLIGRVGRTSSEDVLSWSRDAVLARHAEVRRAQEALTGLRAGASEPTVEGLFTSVFGFGPVDGDLARMAGMSALRAATATRKAMMLAAVKSRLNIIEELLQHAVETAPAAVAAPKRMPLPKLPAGKYAARGDGVARPVEDALYDGRAIVLDQGRRTKHEWLFAHDEQGRHLVTVSSALRSRVEFDPKLFPEIFSPRHRVTVHHNHPSSTSFSGADLVAFKHAPGLDTLYAHGHNGSSYRVRVLKRTDIGRLDDYAIRRTKVYLSKAAARGQISVSDADLLFAHVRMLALARKMIVDYSAELTGASAIAAQRNAEVIDDAVRDVAAHIPD